MMDTLSTVEIDGWIADFARPEIVQGAQ